MASTDEPPLYHLHDVSVRQQQQQHQLQQLQQQSLPPRPSWPMTPPELDHDGHLSNSVGDVAGDLDKLVHRLNRRPILQDSLRWHFLDKEEGNEEATEETGRDMGIQCEQPNVFSTQTPMPPQPSEPTPALDPIQELSMSCNPCPSTIPPLCDNLQPPDPFHFDNIVADAPSDNKSPSKTNDAKRSRRATDVRLHKSASNLRMLGLVTDMIENGVQCNVQSSTPPSPTGASSTSLAVPASMRYAEPHDSIDSHLLPGRMQLEVDMGFSELDEEAMLNDNLALRHASTPAGIRKFGFLRYRSSTEAAQSCKNMKKSAPRMRRRHKTNSTSTPATSAPASRPPSSVA
ncbi:hypothetical protein GQX73_g3997 [Xylaria multiplex]|uniref:Uncharacterized protein n=1 Tax=Xylaria multiplex TaxID=323545 RepID=A0A7C8IWE4_9PEZI|nr:hypothetical protein GQX73_g3997 [Xylaria multiplex]